MKHQVIVQRKPETFIAIHEDGKLRKIQAFNLIPKGESAKLVLTNYDPEKEEKERRTLAQNNYYHMLLDIICDHTGDEHMDLHTQLKIRFLSRPYVLDEREVIVIGHTRDLTIPEFGEYLEKVFKFASEYYQLVLPEPKY